MSEPGNSAAPAPASTDPVAPVTPDPNSPPTSVDIPPDGGFPPEPVPEPEPVAAAPTDPTTEPPKAPKKDAYQKRIDTLTAQREAEKRRADEALRQAELYKAMAEGKSAPTPDPAVPDPAASAPGTAPSPGAFATQADFQRAVQEEAKRQATIAAVQARSDELLTAGRAEFPDFDARCNEVARLGAGDRGDFMEVISDPSIISDGHKLIAQLSEHPEEAERILKLPTLKMSAALVKFQVDHNKPAPPKPVSAAPPPIKPIDGTARADTEPKDTDDMATYAAKYRKIQADKMKSQSPARFAKF